MPEPIDPLDLALRTMTTVLLEPMGSADEKIRAAQIIMGIESLRRLGTLHS